jgi:hypothetical protein
VYSEFLKNGIFSNLPAQPGKALAGVHGKATTSHILKVDP